MTGTEADARAVKTDLTLADGSVESAEVAGAGTITSLRFFVLVVPLGAPLDRLDFLDAAGEVIDSQPVDQACSRGSLVTARSSG